MTSERRPEQFAPRVDAAIAALRPDFTALSIVAENAVPQGPTEWIAARLQEACASVGEGPAWAEAHLASWADAFRSFGAKPQRTPCSAEALRKRAGQGGVPSIHPVVDLYNAVSIAYAIPVGGEDIGRYEGPPRLVRAAGDEPFETTKDGGVAIEYPDKGEAIWRDDRGVTCRRWNWRQGPRTRITPESGNLWFILERLDPMPHEALAAAGDRLEADLLRLAPGARIHRLIVTA